MKKIITLTFFLILVACTPQVTVTSQVTVTLAPPTEIPSPTPEPISQEFNSLQQQIAQSQNYTLTQNGEFEFQTEEGVVIIIPDIKVSKVNGEVTFTENGEKVKLELESVDTIDDLIVLIDKNNTKFVIDKKILILQETQTKLDQAGIDTDAITSDNNGLHITLEGLIYFANPKLLSWLPFRVATRSIKFKKLI